MSEPLPFFLSATTSMPPIVFYDIPSTLPNKAWSPNTWKIRYALNYKGIAYKTVWLEYPEIEPLSKEIGAAPTSNKRDGRPHYTLPMIHDPSTGTVVSDSTKIALYLDATYPDTPRLMPMGTIGLHRAFEDAGNAAITPLYPFALPPTNARLNPASEVYFRRTREEAWGVTPFENLVPTGEKQVVEWAKLKEGFGKMDEWVRANGEGGAYLMGEAPCFADIWMASYVLWIKLVMPERWEEIKEWHGGRWATLLGNMEKYESVV
ncbi:hypothetical protein DFH09DRAFT_1183768 [Mycena vulgaris]|nr:hypothetical protein DFH09DRAFT_1183768 [Mycena vulgaris]